jgi:amino acid transporter
MQKKYSLTVATIICINAMIGSGVFVAPVAIAQIVGPAGILSYLFVICAVWSMALSFSRLCVLYPEDGSFYSFSKPWAGHYGGLFFASLYTAGLLVASSVLLHFAGMYCTSLIPFLTFNQWSFLILGCLSTSLLYGVTIAGLWQYVLVAATVFPIFVTIVICFLNGSFDNFVPFAPHGLGAIFDAIKYVIFGFFGFEFSTALYNHIENPEKNVRKALTYSIMFVGSLYLLFIIAIIYGIPIPLLKNATTISTAFISLFPQYRWISEIMNISIISATLGTIHAMMLTLTALTRKLFAIASNNRFESSCPFNIRSKESFWIALVTLIMFIIYNTFQVMDSMLAMAAIAIVLSYISAIITVVLKEKSYLNKCIASCGIITGFMIVFFAWSSL